MQKQFIVKTPFGIGVATSEEDLKDMLSFVEGISGEGAEQGEAQQEEACDCENCQHNARVSGEKIAGLTELLASIDNIDVLRFMENDAVIHRNAAAIAQGEDHPQVAHLEKVVSCVKERIAELKKEDGPTSEEMPEPMSDEELLERLSIYISMVGSMNDLTVLDDLRNFMTRILGSENLDKRREAELLIGKIDERFTELTGESDADKVEGKTTWGKRNPELLDLDHVSKTVDIGADMLASIDLGYAVTKPQMVNLISRSVDILDEYLKSETDKVDTPETPVEDSPAEDPEVKQLFTVESIKDMTDYDKVDKLQIELEGELSRLADKKQATIDEVHAEMKRIEDLHSAAAAQKSVILDNKADVAHADMADKVKALQEAITRSQPHLLIHDDIREAMEILQERYRK